MVSRFFWWKKVCISTNFHEGKANIVLPVIKYTQTPLQHQNHVTLCKNNGKCSWSRCCPNQQFRQSANSHCYLRKSSSSSHVISSSTGWRHRSPKDVKAVAYSVAPSVQVPLALALLRSVAHPFILSLLTVRCNPCKWISVGASHWEGMRYWG